MQTGCKSPARASGFPLVHTDPQRPSARLRGGPPQPGSRMERAAAWLSVACAIHCLLVPVGAALLPLLGSGLSAFGRAADPLLIVLVVAGAGGSAVFGYRRHHDLRLSLTMGAFLLLYLVGHGLEEAWYGRALAVFSGLSLALASFASARLGHVHTATCAH